jgi:hypothetical protein
MRIMVKFRFPVDEGNEIIRTGRIAQIFQQLADDLKPEAAYFYPDGGERSGHFIVNMQEGSDVAVIAERFFFGLHADIEMTPVMTAEDLQKALGGIKDTVERYA